MALSKTSHIYTWKMSWWNSDLYLVMLSTLARLEHTFTCTAEQLQAILKKVSATDTYKAPALCMYQLPILSSGSLEVAQLCRWKCVPTERECLAWLNTSQNFIRTFFMCICERFSKVPWSHVLMIDGIPWLPTKHLLLMLQICNISELSFSNLQR